MKNQSPEVQKNEYECANCHNIYEKGWSDEEALKETKEIWGEIPESEQAVICDDCFNKRTMPEIIQIGKEYQMTPNKQLIFETNDEAAEYFFEKVLGGNRMLPVKYYFEKFTQWLFEGNVIIKSEVKE